MDLKNMTMDDLKAKFATIDKKTLIKFGSGFGAILIFLIIYYAVLNPMVKERKEIYNDKITKENEIVESLIFPDISSSFARSVGRPPSKSRPESGAVSVE